MKKCMRVFVKALLCSVLPFSLLLGALPVAAYTGSSSKALTSGADIRVMSYNTLVDNDEENGGWSWGQALGNRAEKAAAAIEYYKPDVIGLQENNYNWHVALRSLLPDYDYVNADVPEQQKLEKPESLGKKDWMCTTMMYNTKTLELVYNELTGYSVNYWGSIQRMRYLSMAVFKVKVTSTAATTIPPSRSCVTRWTWIPPRITAAVSTTCCFLRVSPPSISPWCVIPT